MVNSLKKMDKKFLIFAGGIICLPIVIIFLLFVMQSCGNSKMTPQKYESQMISAAEKYFKDKNKIPKEEGETASVKLSTLVESEYIKSTEKKLDDATCTGSVQVRRNGSSIEANNGGYLNYTVTLKCDEYSTVHLVDKLTENIVTTESGLYKVGNEYIFKGDKANNYITVYGKPYRIMSIDKDGILKLIRTEVELTARIWDNKFNVEANRTLGKNIYKDSVLLNYLLDDYKNPKKVNTVTKEHMVAYDVCVGKRSNTDYSISKEKDCSERLEKQVISIMNVSDFALASTDPDCKTTNSKACKNYNYLSKVATSSWTLNASSDNSYEVFYISDGLQYVQTANLNYNAYNIIIYLDGNELYNQGTGTLSNPYILE